MKVGIYTIHACNNYGAMLQAYATQKALEKLDVEAEIVNYYPREQERINRYVTKPKSLKDAIKVGFAIMNPAIHIKTRRFEEFHNMMHLSKRYYSLDEIYQCPPDYDLHLVGSDQVWNLERGFSVRNYFFLDFLDDGQRKVAFASSFGNPNISEATYPQLKNYLCKFEKICIREESGVKLLKDATGLDATHVLDPTFLLSKDEWMNVAEEEPIVKGNYILYYGFDRNDTCRKMIQLVREKLAMPVVAISVSTFVPYKFDKFIQSAGPREFINLLANASFVITSSFHGLAFATNFRKDFIVMRTGTRMSRMESLLHEFGFGNRQVDSLDETDKLLNNDVKIDYSQNEQAIDAAIKRTKECLYSLVH